MDLIKLFKDEALIEILEFADVSIITEDDHQRIYVKPFDETNITKTQMEVVIDFFVDYQIELILIDAPIFRIEDYEVNEN